MAGRAGKNETETLRRHAESALRRARGREHLEPLLERLLRAAERGSDHAVFAHRHLAELLLESHPWRAALHLREITRADRADDVVHALMGLCQALLGNFESAVSAYRRALSTMPRNPWYHHNLGHLLDVALGRPEQAEDHLRDAHDMEPLEHEITASLAHCLACLRRLEEARELAEEAVQLEPNNRDHRALLAWVEDGAREDAGPKVPARASRSDLPP
jgi:Flp pilus assembly protein TadD